MCLAVPAKLIEQDGHHGVVDMHGNHLPVNTMMTPDAQSGDWILIHAGFAIERLDPEEARKTWALIADVQRAGGERAAQEPPQQGRSSEPSTTPGGML